MTNITAEPRASLPPPAPPSVAARLPSLGFGGPISRLLMLLVLWLLLQIPLNMITGLVQERQARRDAAVAEVQGIWGGTQQIIGPILRVPYIERGVDAQGKPWTERRAAYLLPESLAIDAQLKTEERQRGLFSVPVYGATLQLKGHFQRPDLSAWIGDSAEPLWQQAELQIGISDVRAIHADGQLIWLGRPQSLQPSMGAGGESAGVHVALGETSASLFRSDGRADFSAALHFNGSGNLQLAPVGRDTTATIAADWGDPSFQGAWLPTGSSVGPRNFVGHWSVSYLGRGYPQQWTTSGHLDMKPLGAQLFGVALLTPVDAYRMAERVTKYAVLAAFFTFLTIWLTEVLARRRVHPVQYLLLGAALTLFGLLQLAIGEHFGFEPGFIVATVAITGMVTLYSKAALDRWRRALTVGALLGGLYGYLYLLLRAEDYALLGGSIALFVGLAVVMLLTRKIDWHRLGHAGN
jgi:inner membrane protein